MRLLLITLFAISVFNLSAQNYTVSADTEIEPFKLDSSFFSDNRERLTSLKGENTMFAIYSTDETISDIYYFTGLKSESSAFIQYGDSVILFAVEPTKRMLIYDNIPTFDELRQLSGINSIMPIEKYDSVFSSLSPNFKIVYTNNPLRQYTNFKDITEELRAVKSEAEIEQIKRACAITVESFCDLLTQIHPQITESQVEALLTAGFKMRGGEVAFETIAAAGRNGLMLHYKSNSGVCKAGELFLLDSGASYNGYAADMSQTFPVSGKFTSRQRECYEAALRLFNYSKTLYKAGVTIKEINTQIRAELSKELFLLGLIDKKEAKLGAKSSVITQFLPHGCCHSIGLEVHDPLPTDKALKDNMLITCEPGIYIRDEGIAIRIETIMLVNGDSPIDLMPDVPRKVEALEANLAL